MTTAILLCLVASVYDGDGPIRCKGSRVPMRLFEILAPDFENAPPCRERPRRPGYVCDDKLAAESRDALRRLILGKQMRCTTAGQDRYRRVLVKGCTVNGVSVPGYMLGGGWAVAYRRVR